MFILNPLRYTTQHQTGISRSSCPNHGVYLFRGDVGCCQIQHFKQAVVCRKYS